MVSLNWSTPSARDVDVADEPRRSGLLDAIATPVVVVNRDREVVLANTAFHSRFAGVRPDDSRIGDVFACRVAARAPAGCGTAPACAACGFKAAIRQASEEPAVVSEHVLAVGGRSFQIEVTVQIAPHDPDLVICTVRDISGEVHKIELENLFFHDVLNTAGAVQSAAEMLDVAGQDDLVEIIRDTSRRLVESLSQHRLLAVAETGNLEVVTRPVELLGGAVVPSVAQFDVEAIAEGVEVAVLPGSREAEVVTDLSLLRRVLDNLIRNACEASESGDTVVVGVRPVAAGGGQITVRNPATPPRDVASRMFTRAFSTKGPGRGYGTRSVLVLTERYLGGTVEVDFSRGTTVTVTLPAAIGR